MAAALLVNVALEAPSSVPDPMTAPASVNVMAEETARAPLPESRAASLKVRLPYRLSR